jgi:hypothetical protein
VDVHSPVRGVDALSPAVSLVQIGRQVGRDRASRQGAVRPARRASRTSGPGVGPGVSLHRLRHLDLVTRTRRLGCKPTAMAPVSAGRFTDTSPVCDVAATAQIVGGTRSQTHVWALNSPIFVQRKDWKAERNLNARLTLASEGYAIHGHPGVPQVDRLVLRALPRCSTSRPLPDTRRNRHHRFLHHVRIAPFVGEAAMLIWFFVASVSMIVKRQVPAPTRFGAIRNA